jgi:hypothetical protein
MDERLLKQWEVTGRLLQSAASEITSPMHQQEFAHYLNHNELELALDVLEAGAAEQKVSGEFWWHMKKAAEVMGLTERRKLFQVKMQECRRGRQDS